MTKYTLTVFKWTGTFYNAQYNTSHQATIQDNDESYDGSGDTSEHIRIDGGKPDTTSGEPYSIDVAFTDTSGAPHVETFHFFNTGEEWYFAAGPDTRFSEGATLGDYQSHTVGWDYDTLTCFGAGTLIETPTGRFPVETLRKGQEVCLHGGGTATLRAVLARSLGAVDLWRNPKLRPVRITRGALGCDRPNADLLISRQHRMLLISRAAGRMFGHEEALVAAIRLTGLPGIYIDGEVNAMTYHHLVFSRHEVVIANGAPSESLFPGREAIRGLDADARTEVLSLFPGLSEGAFRPRPARFMPSPPRQKALVRRHQRNGLPVLAGIQSDPRTQSGLP